MKQASRTAWARVACACVLALSLALCLAVAGCSPAAVDDASPRVVDVQLSSTSQMSEATQSVEIKLVFDQSVSVSGDAADDFEVLINGAAPDSSTIAVSARASANAVTIVLTPAEGASLGGSTGSFFALYQSAFEVSSAREDGGLSHVTGSTGAAAVLDGPVEGVLPSGLAIEVVSERAGSSGGGVPAQTTFRVTSPALVRAITWFSIDGGATPLLKHNHTFASSDASACAEDLAKVVNAAGLGVTAQASGDEVTLTATEVTDGQVIEPCVVEGVGAQPGTYDASQGMGE